MTSFDVTIVGGGHNGLVAGCYLAKSGLDVGIFEANSTVGGGLHTTSFADHPEFHRNHHAVFLGGMIGSPVRADLNLERHGAELVHPPVKMALPTRDDRVLVLYEDPQRTKRSIAQFSRRDAERYEELYHTWMRMANKFQRPEWYTPPRTLDERREYFSSELGQEYLDLCERRPVDVIKDEFENKHVQAFFTGIIAAAEPQPFHQGLDGVLVGAFTRRHDLCIARGGSNTYAQALRRCFEAAGGTVSTNRSVDRITVTDGSVTGISLSSGTEISSDIVISTVHYPQTYLDLVGRDHLPESFVTGIESDYELNDGTLFGVHLALEEPPRFASNSHAPDIDRAPRYLVGYETIAERERCHQAVSDGRIPNDPILNAGAVSIVDPTQAPEDKYTAHLWAPVPWNPDSESAERWDELKAEYMDVCIDQFANYAPNITRETIIEAYAHSPVDISRAYANRLRGLSTGGGKMESRPTYVGPLENLYLAGAPVHPGGSIHGAPGYICSGIVVDDLGIEKWWDPPTPDR